MKACAHRSNSLTASRCRKLTEAVAIELEYEDYSAAVTPLDSLDGEEKMDDRIRAAVATFVRSFDLTRAPLMRAGLIKLREERHVLMVDLHHIVSDGLSQDIFVNDFLALYAGRNCQSCRCNTKIFPNGKTG